ncbi:MAG: DUF3604 domain-containing protein [Pseudomonadales bacterium]
MVCTAWALATLVLLGGLGAAADTDYLSPELRARVEQLKADVAVAPTTAENHQARAEVLWQWANAYALDGRYVPVNLTAGIRPQLPTPSELQAAAAAVDAYVRELKSLDEDPGIIGELSADTGPFQARSQATLQQTWRVGTRAVQRGGAILVTRHFMADYGAFQTADPGAENYVSIRASRADVRFEPEGVPVAGMHGGFRGAEEALAFRLTAGTLQPGDSVTVTYGDRSAGGSGLLMPTMSSDRMPFPLYVSFDQGDQFFSLPIQPIRVDGAEVAGVHAFSPSVVRPGESFALSVRAQDRFYNRATGPQPAWQVLANGEVIAEIPAGSEAITVLQGLAFAEPGVYRISVRSADGAIRGAGNPMLVSADAPRVYWGDTHGHSGFAEGIGTPDRFMTWARDDARLDFVTHSEHDIWMDDSEWEVLRNNVARYSVPGQFVAFLGYEWTTRNLYGGHHNVLFRTPEGRRRAPTQFYPTLSSLYQGLREQNRAEDVVVIPHAHQAGDYRQSDPDLEPLVEIMSQHGTFEWFGRMYLGHGHQVGFTAASDNHLSQPGYTAPKGKGLSQRGGLGGVLADGPSRDAIFDAMRSLRAYATTGDRIILDVRLNGAGMGQRIAMTPDRVIEGRVVGTAPIDTITLVKNDQEIWSRDYLSVTDGRFDSEESFYLTFESASVPMQRGDNPRGWRPWAGTLEVEGARLLEISPTDFFNPDVQQLEVDPANGNRVRFATATRGDTSSLLLRLADAGPRTRVRVEIEPGREFGGGPPIFRRHAALPGSSITLSLRELQSGQVSVALPFEIYDDTVTLRRLHPQGADDVRFRVEDSGNVQGDYYYVRVKQANDAMAWSSPIWVGSYPSR